MFVYDIFAPVAAKLTKEVVTRDEQVKVGKGVVAGVEAVEAKPEIVITNETLDREENYISTQYENWVNEKGENNVAVAAGNMVWNELNQIFKVKIDQGKRLLPSKKEMFLPGENGIAITSVGVVPNDLLDQVANHLNFYLLFFALNYEDKSSLGNLYNVPLVQYFSIIKETVLSPITSYTLAYPFRAVTNLMLTYQKIFYNAVKKNTPLEKIDNYLKNVYTEGISASFVTDLFLSSILVSLYSLKSAYFEGKIDDERLKEECLDFAIMVLSYFSVLDKETNEGLRKSEFTSHIILPDDEPTKKEMQERYLGYFYENIIEDEGMKRKNNMYIYGVLFAKERNTFEEVIRDLAAEALMIDNKSKTSAEPVSDDNLAILIENQLLEDEKVNKLFSRK
jgi:hypothetical protein